MVLDLDDPIDDNKDKLFRKRVLEYYFILRESLQPAKIDDFRQTLTRVPLEIFNLPQIFQKFQLRRQIPSLSLAIPEFFQGIQLPIFEIQFVQSVQVTRELAHSSGIHDAGLIQQKCKERYPNFPVRAFGDRPIIIQINFLRQPKHFLAPVTNGQQVLIVQHMVCVLTALRRNIFICKVVGVTFAVKTVSLQKIYRVLELSQFVLTQRQGIVHIFVVRQNRFGYVEPFERKFVVSNQFINAAQVENRREVKPVYDD